MGSRKFLEKAKGTGNLAETVGFHRKEDPGGYGLRTKVTSSISLFLPFLLGFW